MPNQSGGADQVISLPKGGGALKGLGEKFQPDLYTGTGNFSVPIAVPPGRNGFHPQLALTYSTGQGNGPFGLGWSLGIPGVTLKTSKGIPRYEGEDVYVLSGAEDLVLVKEDSASSLYRPRTEGLFARIVHHQETNNDYWEVRSKDGLISLYGTPGTAGHDPAVIAAPADRTKVFAWKLTQTEDPYRNRIVYEYVRDLDKDGPHHWDQLYLQHIRYIDYTAQGETKYLVSVTFFYADRLDPFSDYRAGFEIRTTKRCTRIEICTHAEGDHLVRTYHLRYLDQQPFASEDLPLNKLSLLHQIRVEGGVTSTEEAGEAHNLLSNPDFTTADPDGLPAPVTGAGRSGPSAAVHWSVWNNYDATTETELVESDFHGATKKMIHVITSGQQNGLVQTFLPYNAGPLRVIAGAWVRVRRGRVCIGTGNGGYTGVDTVSNRTNDWEHLQALNGVSPANELIIYSASADGADFDVAVASVVPPSEWLPPLEFNYTRFEPTKRHFFPLQGRDLPARSLANPDLELVDLFGNGLPDILEMNGTVRYWRNLGGGQFDRPREMRTAPAGVGLADKGVQLIDANGDGRMDLLVTTESLAGYYPLQFGGLWDQRSFQAYRQAPSFDLKDPEVRLLDLDGDGVTDAIRSGSRLECFFNDPKDGWNGTRWVERRALAEFPNINFSDARVKWADMSGDGLQDIVLVHDGNVEYWPNLGYGNWGKRIHMRNSPRFPYGYDPKRILVGDVDGDGLADMVYVDNTKITLWINQSGNAWSDPVVIKGTPRVSDMDAVRLADVLGTGISGVLWSADAGGLARDHVFFLDLSRGSKPYLLQEMNNNIGAITRVEYAPSIRLYLADEQRPATRWKTPLPFPVQVVARVEAIDAISGGKLTTEYRYHHGYWDGAEREFRGFGRADQRDSETFDVYHASGLHPKPVSQPIASEHFSPPTETRTWFHQGPIGDEFGGWEETDFSREFWSGDPQVLTRPQAMTQFLRSLPRRVKRDALRTLRGHILRTELYALDGTSRQDRPYTVTEQVYGVREELPSGLAVAGGDSGHIFFPYAVAQRTTQWERGSEPLSSFMFTGDYDTYGQPRLHINIAVPRGRDFRVAATTPSEPYLATESVTDYAQRDDAQVLIVDRVARTTDYEIVNDGRAALLDLKTAIENGIAWRTLISQTVNFYDGEAFKGLPLGQIGNYGALVPAIPGKPPSPVITVFSVLAFRKH